MKYKLAFLLLMLIIVINIKSYSQGEYKNCRSLFEGKTDNCTNSYNYYSGYSSTGVLFGIESSGESVSLRVGVLLFSAPYVSKLESFGFPLTVDAYLIKKWRNNPYLGVSLVICGNSYSSFNCGYRFISRNSLFQLRLGGNIMIIDKQVEPAAEVSFGVRLR